MAGKYSKNPENLRGYLTIQQASNISKPRKQEKCNDNDTSVKHIIILII
jgi:hypothetical protein